MGSKDNVKTILVVGLVIVLVILVMCFMQQRQSMLNMSKKENYVESRTPARSDRSDMPYDKQFAMPDEFEQEMRRIENIENNNSPIEKVDAEAPESYDQYIRDTTIDPEVSKNHNEWLQSIRPLRQTAGKIQAQVSQPEYSDWIGLRRPKPVPLRPGLREIPTILQESLNMNKKTMDNFRLG
jgi:FtsZ-interacting cell division protein ZipA